MPHRKLACVALLATASCTRDRGPERLAADYAREPKAHYQELSSAAQRWLPLDVFEAEPLPEVPDAICRLVERQPDRLRFACSNSAGRSRPVLLVRERGAWSVAETSRALRLLGKATLELDAFSAAVHGADIDPEEPRFDLPVARHLLARARRARLARERLEEAAPYAERALARANLPAKDRAALFLRRASLELTAARALPGEESRRLLDRSAADAAEALRFDPSLGEDLAGLAGERSRFARVSDLEWLAGELRQERERYTAAAGDAKKEQAASRSAHELASGLLGEGCGKAEEWEAQLESVAGTSVELRVPSGADFAISLSSTAKDPADPGVLEVAGSLKRGACVLFSGRIDPCEKSASEPETLRAPKFAVALEDLRACP